jgi:general bacterial porin, GBP family
MKTSILTSAVLAVLASAPMSASADVQIYGAVQAEYSVEDINGQSAEQGVDDNGLTTHIGFKATEKLGNGMTAIALLEFNANPADNNNGLGDNQQFVGLKHDKWGFLALGTMKSPYRTAGGERIDPFYETSLQATTAGGMSGTLNGGTLAQNGYVSSAIYYQAPTFANLTVDFIISPDEKNNGAKDNETVVQNGDDNDYAVGFNYESGPLYAFASYASNSIDGASNEDAWKLGASMSMGDHTVSGQYEWIDNVTSTATAVNTNGLSNFSATAGSDAEIWFLGYQYAMGNNTLVAQFGETDSDNNGSEAEYMAIGVIHNFSSRTRVFAGYSETDSNQASADREVFTIGLTQNF